MILKFPIIWIMAIVPMALSGCVSASTTWKRGSATADQFAVDKAACQSYAHRELDEAYSDRTKLSRYGGVNNDAPFNVLMQKHDLRRSFRTQFERCMRRRGYREVDLNTTSKRM